MELVIYLPFSLFYISFFLPMFPSGINCALIISFLSFRWICYSQILWSVCVKIYCFTHFWRIFLFYLHYAECSRFAVIFFQCIEFSVFYFYSIQCYCLQFSFWSYDSFEGMCLFWLHVNILFASALERLYLDVLRYAYHFIDPAWDIEVHESVLVFF